MSSLLAVQRTSYSLETPREDVEDLGAGTFDQAPNYLDNFTGAGYDVLTGQFRLVYGGSRFVDFTYSDVLRQLRRVSSPAAPIPHAAAPEGGGADRWATLAVRFYYRSRQTGLIHPAHADRGTLPNLSLTVDLIDGQRRSRERHIIVALIDGAVAARGMASGALTSSQIASHVDALRRQGVPETRRSQHPGSPEPRQLPAGPPLRTPPSHQLPARVTTEGRCPVGIAGRFVIEEHEASSRTVIANAEIAAGAVQIIGVVRWVGRELHLDQAHIQGPGLSTGIRAVGELRALMRDFGRAQGAARIIVHPGARTTGTAIGRIPSRVDLPCE